MNRASVSLLVMKPAQAAGGAPDRLGMPTKRHPYEIITDNAAGYFLRSGKVNKVFFGADRVAANGDVVNKVGSYMVSLAAHANHVPVYSVFPLSTLDLTLSCGDLVPIEERDAGEVLDLAYKGEAVAPLGARALNPAFDVTPHELLTALVTEVAITPRLNKNWPLAFIILIWMVDMALVITGSVAFDYLMTFPGYFRENILPDKLDKSPVFLVTACHGSAAGSRPPSPIPWLCWVKPPWSSLPLARILRNTAPGWNLIRWIPVTPG
jgi:hypothetical protein